MDVGRRPKLKSDEFPDFPNLDFEIIAHVCEIPEKLMLRSWEPNPSEEFARGGFPPPQGSRMAPRDPIHHWGGSGRSVGGGFISIGGSPRRQWRPVQPRPLPEFCEIRFEIF